MTVPLKSVPPTQPNLAERMAITEPGQVTWADPSIGAKCTACRFYRDGGKKTGKYKGFGRCHLAKLHTKKDGNLFHGPTVYACPKFEKAGPDSAHD